MNTFFFNMHQNTSENLCSITTGRDNRYKREKGRVIFATLMETDNASKCYTSKLR